MVQPVTIESARSILNSRASDLTDKQIGQILEQLRHLCDVCIEQVINPIADGGCQE